MKLLLLLTLDAHVHARAFYNKYINNTIYIVIITHLHVVYIFIRTCAI